MCTRYFGSHLVIFRSELYILLIGIDHTKTENNEEYRISSMSVSTRLSIELEYFFFSFFFTRLVRHPFPSLMISQFTMSRRFNTDKFTHTPHQKTLVFLNPYHGLSKLKKKYICI